MNPRILKKLSKRALPLLAAAGVDHGRDCIVFSERGDDCDVRCQRMRSLEWVSRKPWNERAANYPDCLPGTPIVYRHGIDYFGEGDEGATAWAQLVLGVDTELCDVNSFALNGVVWRKINNPAEYLRHARDIAKRKKRAAIAKAEACPNG